MPVEVIRRIKQPFGAIPDVAALEKELRERLERIETAIELVLNELRKQKTGVPDE